ncbi:MAG: metal-dependent hydrolase [Acidobacteriota bacterium]
MAFPVGHAAAGLAAARALGAPVGERAVWTLGIALLAVVPDFDYILVWPLGYSRAQYHRTWTHSLLVAAAVALVVALAHARLTRKPFSWRPLLIYFAVVASHGIVDVLMVDNRSEHGVPLFWPFLPERLGWRSPFVPFYELFHPNARNVLRAAVPYTLVELLLGIPVWIWLWRKRK